MTLDPKPYVDLSYGQSTRANRDLTKYTTDILYTQIGLSEGPVYRINPNGPQDVRIGNKFIDDLINEFNEPDPNVFQYKSSPGLVNQTPLWPFGTAVSNPIRFSSPVKLLAGQINGNPTDLPESNVLFFPTTAENTSIPINTIVCKFNVERLYRAPLDNESVEGNQPQRLDLRIIVHPRDETTNIDDYIALVQRTYSQVIESTTTIDIPISIPDSDLSSDGYRISVFKASDDSNTTAIASDVSFVGFDEVKSENFAYPRTATIGYALKSTEFRSDIPSYSTMVKGIICKVPNNYNQPTLDSGEVDWRELEVDDPTQYGYLLQDTPSGSIAPNPVIYKGVWNGGFKWDWTQNPIWILYDLLTSTTHGLGLPPSSIDKFSFYRAAQFCDAVDPHTGRFIGVEAYADGTFRHQTRGQFSNVLQNQIGLLSSVPIRERRFIADVNLPESIDTLDLISKVIAGCRGIVTTNANKIRVKLDYQEDYPEQLFTDSNMSNITYSGVRQEDITTGVELVFFDGANNYEREVIFVSDPDLENLPTKNISLELPFCTRRSQAMRFAQYILATSKYLRRKIAFNTDASCEDLDSGAIISISTQTTRLDTGYNGIIQESSNAGSSNLKMQHIGHPSITQDVFTSNNQPLAVRHFSAKSNKNEIYLVSNTNFNLATTGNSYSGFDYLELSIDKVWDTNIGTFTNFLGFDDFNNPEHQDLWSFGEINPNNIGESSDKLFRVDTINMTGEGTFSITATEHVSNVYLDSESLINYEPTPSKTIVNLFARPNVPQVSISTSSLSSASGAVTTTINFSVNSPTGNYSVLSAFLPITSLVPILGVL